MLYQIEKVKKGKWNVINAGGEIVHTAKTKTECEMKLQELYFKEKVAELAEMNATVQIFDEPELECSYTADKEEEKPTKKISNRTQINKMIEEMVDISMLKVSMMNRLESFFPEISRVTLATYLSDAFNTKYSYFTKQNKKIVVYKDGSTGWGAL